MKFVYSRNFSFHSIESGSLSPRLKCNKDKLTRFTLNRQRCRIRHNFNKGRRSQIDTYRNCQSFPLISCISKRKWNEYHNKRCFPDKWRVLFINSCGQLVSDVLFQNDRIICFLCIRYREKNNTFATKCLETGRSRRCCMEIVKIEAKCLVVAVALLKMKKSKCFTCSPTRILLK